MKTRIVFLLGIAAVLSCNLDAAQKDPFIKTIETIKRSTVAVACIEQTSATEFSLASIEGTGFFISSDGTFLTAGHVARGLYLAAPPRQKPCPIPAIYFPQEDWKEGTNTSLNWFKIDKRDGHDGLDLARCTVIDNRFTYASIKIKPLVISFDTSLHEEGTQLAFTGFPLSLVRPLTVRGCVGSA
jgi:hypothetical protein